MTDEGGGYRFDNVAIGDYIVRFQPPLGLDFTSPNIGDDATDSDVIGLDPADAGFGETGLFEVLANQITQDINAGLVTDTGGGDPDID